MSILLPRIGWLAIALVGGAHCGAGAAFGGLSTDRMRVYVSDEYACPAERVSVVEGKERPSEVLLRAPENPPPEVAADPARLAIWRAHRKTEAERQDYRNVFEVAACGESYSMICSSSHGNIWCDHVDRPAIANSEPTEPNETYVPSERASANSSDDGVRTFVSTKMACPIERVSAAKLPDRPSEILLQQPENPPPEVAADAERLNIWRANRKAEAERLDQAEVFEVNACGTKSLWFCANALKGHVMCVRVPVNSVDNFR